ncbi:MAG TPA: M67 family metallopeptidase [Candidatus Limnocylindria bacterium]
MSKPTDGALRIAAALADELLAHAAAEAPNEACGILAGSLADGRATAYHPARNADASPFVYTVHPDDLVRIVLGIEDAGQDLVAIFHSHIQSPAVPSPTDRRQARYPDAFYLLATLLDPDVVPMQALRAWRIRNGDATEVPLRIE